MISVRRSKPFQMISIHEPGFMKLERSIVTQYGLSRDLTKVPVEKIEPKPTIFKLLPLQPKYDHFVDVTTDFATLKNIFKTHVIGADNLVDEKGRQVLEYVSDGKGGQILDDKCVDDMPRDIINEVCEVVIQMSRQNTRPFSLPDTYHLEVSRSRVLDSFVETVKDEPASE